MLAQRTRDSVLIWSIKDRSCDYNMFDVLSIENKDRDNSTVKIFKIHRNKEMRAGNQESQSEYFRQEEDNVTS